MTFKKGVSGNPKGRPPAIDTRSADRIRRLIANDVKRHGVDAIERLRVKDPASYWRVVTDIMGLRSEGKRGPNVGISITVKEFKLSRDAQGGITIEHDADAGPARLSIDDSTDDDDSEPEPET